MNAAATAPVVLRVEGLAKTFGGVRAPNSRPSTSAISGGIAPVVTMTCGRTRSSSHSICSATSGKRHSERRDASVKS